MLDPWSWSIRVTLLEHVATILSSSSLEQMSMASLGDHLQAIPGLNAPVELSIVSVVLQSRY